MAHFILLLIDEPGYLCYVLNCMRKDIEVLAFFLSRIESDTRIGTRHISLFVAIWKKYTGNPQNEVAFFSYELMPIAKISSYSTFHKSLKQLDTYGYLTYTPSFNHNCRSHVEFITNK